MGCLPVSINVIQRGGDPRSIDVSEGDSETETRTEEEGKEARVSELTFQKEGQHHE